MVPSAWPHALIGVAEDSSDEPDTPRSYLGAGSQVGGVANRRLLLWARVLVQSARRAFFSLPTRCEKEKERWFHDLSRASTPCYSLDCIRKWLNRRTS